MNNIEILRNFLQTNEIHYDSDVDLKTKTWIKRGGIAKTWISPQNLHNYKKCIIYLQQNRISFEVIGASSNCYFLNDYNPDIVIFTLKINTFSFHENEIICDCGANMVKISKQCIVHGYAGYEGFIGLPGTVAGATINNAGCYGSLMSNIVKYVEIIENGKLKVLKNKDLQYTHRSSILKRQNKKIVTKVCLDISQKEMAEVLEEKAKTFQKHRNTLQEHTFPNLGTVFCKLSFKSMLFHKKVLFKIIRKLISLFIFDEATKKKYNTKLFLFFIKGAYLKNYISEFGIQCFVWKDENADKMFQEYIKFIKNNTFVSEIEIDIKK